LELQRQPMGILFYSPLRDPMILSLPDAHAPTIILLLTIQHWYVRIIVMMSYYGITIHTTFLRLICIYIGLQV
jgi:hypothetical protein